MDVFEQSVSDLRSVEPDKPEEAPQLVIVPESPLLHVNLREIWDYRELLMFLAWRDIKVRYRQTVLGILWAILQPLTAMVIFSIVFGQLAKLPSDGIPYPIFTYAALLPWNLVSTGLSRDGESCVQLESLEQSVFSTRDYSPVIRSWRAGGFRIRFYYFAGLDVVLRHCADVAVGGTAAPAAARNGELRLA